jgi:hypothetical protein
MNGFHLEYRGKYFKVPQDGYNTLKEKLLLDIEVIAKHVIDLYIENNVEFSDLHLFVSKSPELVYYLNFLALG